MEFNEVNALFVRLHVLQKIQVNICSRVYGHMWIQVSISGWNPDYNFSIDTPGIFCLVWNFKQFSAFESLNIGTKRHSDLLGTWFKLI